MVTVIVNYLNLISSTERIRKIGKKVSARKLSISMAESEGEFSEEMLRLADRIYECGLAFAELSEKTGQVLDEARMAFVKADEGAAGQFDG